MIGDFSTLLAGAPAVLSQASYSRDAEREADTESLRLLRAAGIAPAVMVSFFEKVAAWRAAGSTGVDKDPRSGLGIAIASHPADAERARFFREGGP